MELTKIIINDYRQFSDFEICLELEKDLTMIAGANNSGKTSLISLIRKILKNETLTYNSLDVPASRKKEWISEVLTIFKSFFADSNNTVDMVEDKIVNLILPLAGIGGKELKTTTLQFIVSYNPQNDDIKLFADYIMDLDMDEHYFYFYVDFHIRRNMFLTYLIDNYEKLKVRFTSQSDDQLKFNSLMDWLVDMYVKSLECKCYFCNKGFDIKCPMNDLGALRKLFNISFIQANRPIDDNETDHAHGLNHQMMKMVKNEPSWKALVTALPETILDRNQINDVKNKVQTTSLDTLQDSILALENTSGGQPSKIMLDLNITDENVHSFIESTISTSYEVGGLHLGEASQGLGYSNMIYMHLQLKEYEKEHYDPLKVNLFIIEEPESHMHPQMQQVFVKYLLTMYKDQPFQGIVTTHSNEMVRISGLNHLRVIRKTGPLSSSLYDLSTILSEQDGDEELNNFFDWFFEIGYSEVVFADKVIFYEGDTERLFIRKLLSLDKYKKLGQQYIAYVQVGGAYAHNYQKLINLLGIKSLIITDIDYAKGCKNLSAAKKSTSTNAALKHFYKLSTGNSHSPKISDLYDWKKTGGNIISDLIYVAFQTSDDAYARTLEEAMLGKYFSISIATKKKRSEWKNMRTLSELDFSIPNNRKQGVESNFTLRDILASTSNGKTDFMYSVILKGLTESMEPKYISEGLKWLMES